MVNGLDKFSEWFKDYSENYILIGGAACDTQIESAGLSFRATKDLDIILIVEALSPEFAKEFWRFIIEGKYEQKEKSTRDKKYYRFREPKTEGYPFQLELFSRIPDIDIEGDAHLTPIPVGEDISSLSAILLDEDYYNFTIQNSQLLDGLHLASTCALICLKAKAYLDYKKRKESNEQIDSRDIRKHRMDILRLSAILIDEDIADLPVALVADLKLVVEDLRNDIPDGKAVAKGLHLEIAVDINSVIDQLEKTFRLK